MQPYPEGLDCVWLAIDRNGHVGAFITAGLGPIPNTALEIEEIELPDIESALEKLPITSLADTLVEVKNPDSFVALATRGFFVFDWTDIERTTAVRTGKYEPVAVPMTPAHVDSLPDQLKQLARRVVLDAVDFSSQTRVRLADHVKCAGAS